MSDAFFEALKSLQSPSTVEKQYRLYYEPDTGEPLFYTSDDEPGTYIVIDKETYDISNYHCVVKDNKIVNLNIVGAYRKLVPGNSGVTTHKENVMIVAEQGQQWTTKVYEN
jgi:hypothetical protein